MMGSGHVYSLAFSSLLPDTGLSVEIPADWIVWVRVINRAAAPVVFSHTCITVHSSDIHFFPGRKCNWTHKSVSLRHKNGNTHGFKCSVWGKGVQQCVRHLICSQAAAVFLARSSLYHFRLLNLEQVWPVWKLASCYSWSFFLKLKECAGSQGLVAELVRIPT